MGVWANSIYSVFIPQLRIYNLWVEQKFSPSMGTELLEREAAELSTAEEHRLGNSPASDENDGYFVEPEIDVGFCYYNEMTCLRQGLLNLFAVGLHHIFEQQLLRFHRLELLDPFQEFCVGQYLEEFNTESGSLKEFKSLLSPDTIMRQFEKRGINLHDLESWNQIGDLRLIANTIKHADGESCQNLKRKRPDLFANPRLNDDSIEFSPLPLDLPVFQPLTGESIFITEDVLIGYVKAIITFWKYVAGKEVKSDVE